MNKRVNKRNRESKDQRKKMNDPKCPPDKKQKEMRKEIEDLEEKIKKNLSQVLSQE